MWITPHKLPGKLYSLYNSPAPAPSTVILSSRKLAFVSMYRDSCSAQDSGKRNALYFPFIETFYSLYLYRRAML